MRASVALRGWRGTASRIAEEFRSLPETDESLQLLPLDVSFTPFALPCAASPRVSIIIPVHGKLPYTLACLRSLAAQAGDIPFEVVVVDDASPDDSANTLSQIEGLRLLINTSNLGFVGSCNAGAAIARGEYLLFLNNDTQVTAGWLDALLSCFQEQPDCGIAGSRLVYPDGRLQEAGGLIFSDGSCWNVGRFESRDALAWQYRREVDYVSGASLMIPGKLFEAIGGFDEHYAPAYYEDADLAFAVRETGRRVFYVPSSVVIHCEGISAGTDPHGGMKRYQTINQAVFTEKWAAQLAHHPAPRRPADLAVRWRTRGRILVVDAAAPDPSRDSGSLRLVEILRLLVDQGWSVAFYPDDGRRSRDDTARLGTIGVEILNLPKTTHLPRWLALHGKTLDAVMLCRHTVAGQYAHLVRQSAPRARLIFDTVDLHFLREQRASEVSGQTVMARQSTASRQSELELIAFCDITFVVSNDEKSLLKQLLPNASIELLSNIHRPHSCPRPHSGRKDVVFIGGQGHPPNVDAMRWIANDIAPLLQQAAPDMTVHLLGDVSEVLRRELTTDGVTIHGRVADLAPWMEGCIASLAPLRFGAGVKGKINMSMSYGLPVIATGLAAEGMHLRHDEDVLLAENPADFVHAVLRLRDDEALWQRISTSSLSNVEQHFSPEIAASTLRRVLG
ncbi:glycosyltransferase [Dyella koreensis]|uniref:Glycosyltransferase n=2 Tax=Dyella koreensis TaxID=311235 RepID=A0ABW8K770_9GAMM